MADGVCSNGWAGWARKMIFAYSEIDPVAVTLVCCAYAERPSQERTAGPMVRTTGAGPNWVPERPVSGTAAKHCGYPIGHACDPLSRTRPRTDRSSSRTWANIEMRMQTWHQPFWKGIPVAKVISCDAHRVHVLTAYDRLPYENSHRRMTSLFLLAPTGKLNKSASIAE